MKRHKTREKLKLCLDQIHILPQTNCYCDLEFDLVHLKAGQNPQRILLYLPVWNKKLKKHNKYMGKSLKSKKNSLCVLCHWLCNLHWGRLIIESFANKGWWKCLCYKKCKKEKKKKKTRNKQTTNIAKNYYVHSIMFIRLSL